MSPDNLVTGVAAITSGWTYVALSHRHRRHRSERGQGSTSLIVLAVVLVVSITVLSALHSEVPAVLSQALTGVLFGITGGELQLRRAERKGRVQPRKSGAP